MQRKTKEIMDRRSQILVRLTWRDMTRLEVIQVLLNAMGGGVGGGNKMCRKKPVTKVCYR